MTALVSLLLAAATLAVYIRSLGHEFSNIDDVEYILRNRPVLDGLSLKSVLWAFTAFHSANWHPLTWLSHMLDVQLFGLWPGGHHLTNILLHAANSVLLLTALRLMTRSLWKSALVSGLFALHPQHVESVAWIAERKDVLSTFFMMWAILAYLWYANRPSVWRYLLVVLAFALGLMSKPMLVTLPLLLLLMDFWPLRRIYSTGNGEQRRHIASVPQVIKYPSVTRLVVEKLPLLLMSAVSCVLTLKAQSAAGALVKPQLLPLATRLDNAAVSVLIYLAKTFWPTKLANYYPYPRHGWSLLELIAAWALLFGVTCASLAMARRRPYLIWGWLWYLITLVPVIGIVQVGPQARADRYTYIPLIGIFVIIAYAGSELMYRMRLARFQTAAAVSVLVALGTVSFVQVGYWRDGITINERAIAVTKDNWYSRGSLGDILVCRAEQFSDQGKTREARRLARQAEKHLRECLSIAPSCADAHDRLARALGVLGLIDEAIPHLEEAVRLKPHDPEMRSRLGMALQLKGRDDEAIEQFKESIRLNPGYIEGHGNLALAYYRQKDYAKAWEHVRLCEEAGGRAPREFVRKLTAKMRDPER